MKASRYAELVTDLARVLVKAGFIVEAKDYLVARLQMDACEVATAVTDMIFSERAARTGEFTLDVAMAMMLNGNAEDVQEIICCDFFMKRYGYEGADDHAIIEMEWIIDNVLTFPVRWNLIFNEKVVW